MSKNDIVLLNDELGVDLEMVYNKACFYKSRLPQFLDLYDEYKFALIQTNVDVLSHELETHISALREGRTHEGEAEEKPVKSRLEFFQVLLESRYSFQDGQIVYNAPSRDVW